MFWHWNVAAQIPDIFKLRWQTIGCVNFPWLPEPADMPVNGPSIKAVHAALPGNGFGVPDIYVTETEKDEETDRLFLDSDGDYGEETCED